MMKKQNLKRDDLDQQLELGNQVIDSAKKLGADVAEAVIESGSHLTTKSRMGKPELIEEAGSRSLGLRVMVGQQVAVTYTSDLSPAGIKQLVQDAVELARLSEPDSFAGPPDKNLLSIPNELTELNLADPHINDLDAEKAMAMSLEGEQASFDADPRITNSEGGSVTRISGSSTLITSGGFVGSKEGTYASIVVRPIAEDEGGKKRSGYHWDASRFLNKLANPKDVGIEATKKTLAQLGAKKVKTQEAPIVFNPEAARSMIGLFASCISGNAIWRRSSFLVDQLGSQIASELITIVDDPLILGGPGSRAFDGEGLASRKNTVVEKGVLKTYLTDTYSGKKLNMPSTANASRGSSGSVGVGTTNFVLSPGKISEEKLIQDTGRGLYVTEMMGYGFNATTGDFSRGASGFWIENGELAFPVSEITISLNFKDLLKRIDAIANNIDARSSTMCASFRVSSMTIAGE